MRTKLQWMMSWAIVLTVGCSGGASGTGGDGGASGGQSNGDSGGTNGANHGGSNASNGNGGEDDGGADAAGSGGAIDPVLCGNLEQDPNEECDDGNEQSGDGCSECLIDKGFHCPAFGVSCDECGDGILQELSEACDDGNRKGGDGCSKDCQLEGEGWQCPVENEPCEQCGDGTLDTNERCDDGNLKNGDGCSADCYQIAEHFACPTAGELCEECGDGEVGVGEVCDDGDSASLDGCTFNCKNIEAGYACPATGGACTVCGDGEIVAGVEECDDGNFRAGDGCDANCQSESGATCLMPGQLCFVCGNGFIEPVSVNTQGTADPGDDVYTLEECDDGNGANGDGCSATCMHTAGYQCPVPGFGCNQCGDGLVTGLEACDDSVGGTPVGGDGCSADCYTREPFYVCPIAGEPCERCGDGLRDFHEECDDGTQCYGGSNDGSACTADSDCGGGVCAPLGGDGCSRTCTVEPGWTCQENADSSFGGCSLCGDGKKQLDEACDDNNLVGNDGCAADCSAVETGYNCFFEGFACAPCGDGIVQPGEKCDEGAVNKTDGCDSTCHVVSPWVCFEAGKPCELCGDGVLGANYETCDDSGLVNDDGCSSTCEIEPGWTCDPTRCVAVACGDGFRAGNEGCDDGNELSGDGCSTACKVERGYVCSSTGCRKTECGDTVVEGQERCDDGKACSDGVPCLNDSECTGVGDGLCAARASDGCNDACQLEPGSFCPDPGQPCKSTVCGDGFVEGLEQCDEVLDVMPSGCDPVSCQFVDGNACPVGDTVCHGGAQDGQPCTSELSCDDGDCSPLGGACHETTCNDGIVEGTEECDDGNAPAVCRGGTLDGSACSSDGDCTGGGSCLDGCTSTCTVKPLYRCDNDPGQPSTCRPILELVAIRRFTVANVSPVSLTFDPLRRSFIGYKSVDSQTPIELCLDGTLINDGVRLVCVGGANDGKACAGAGECPSGVCGEIVLGQCTGGTKAGAACSIAGDCPGGTCSSGYEPGRTPTSKYSDGAYDPFTGHTLFLDENGDLADIPLCDRYDPSCPTTGLPVGTVLAQYQADLGDSGLKGVTVGTDGDLYVAYSASGTSTIRVHKRRRNLDGTILIPSCTTPVAVGTNCTSFEDTFTTEFSVPVKNNEDLLALFTVPGEYLVGSFNDPGAGPTYTGHDALLNTTVTSSEYFRFFADDGGLYGQSALPGFLFDLGEIGKSYTKHGASAETAARGGSFVLCPLNPSEPCQLFARTCETDADCAEIFPGTQCNVAAAVPYCSAPGRAVDDRVIVNSGVTDSPVDVLANDSLSESACADSTMRVVSLTALGTTSSTVTTTRGGTATITNGGADVTYDAPSDATLCGFIDTFEYTADLGGGVMDTATVRVVVACDCGDGIKQASEQCDLGDANNGPIPSRCSADCALNIVCGDSFVDPGEECDDNNSTSGDGCSTLCTLESACGDGVTEGAEACDPNDPAAPLGCRENCTLPDCGDGVVDVIALAPEQCDDGVSNGVYPAPCSAACTFNSSCGDGAIQGLEECDDGASNGTADSTCSVACKVNAACGNGLLEPSEECDASVAASQCGGHTCQVDRCLCENYCGDARIGGLEECDDGNTNGTDACRGTEQVSSELQCTLVLCGDGIKDTQVFAGHAAEQCDDGNSDPTDGCTNDCKIVVVCGDGTKTAPEACDDGNNVSGDGCSSSCKDETVICGDGSQMFPEECDDGALNGTNSSTCTTLCRFANGTCGNGTLDSGEQCDDNNRDSGDGCDVDCHFEGCGDGVIVPAEDCDDGNRTSFDGCSATCQIEVQ